jgi:hypothetical protein
MRVCKYFVQEEYVEPEIVSMLTDEEEDYYDEEDNYDE